MGYHQALPPTELPPLLSAERMGTYHRLAPEWGVDPIELYLIGVELASSYMADLHFVEVTMRNAMNDQLTAQYGPRWWANADLLDDRSQAAIAKAHADAHFGDGDRPGRLLAQLPLGFWVHLLEVGGHTGKPPFRQRREYEALLWRPALRHAFPHSSRRRDDVHATAARVYALRNRVAHHEPVVNGVRLPGVPRSAPGAYRSPREIHDDLVSLVRMISIPVGDWVAHHSRTPALLNGVPH